jgi:hypothetical protein
METCCNGFVISSQVVRSKLKFARHYLTKLTWSAWSAEFIVQGSGIGPTMLIIFIDELVKILEVHGICVKFFADDSKLYAK